MTLLHVRRLVTVLVVPMVVSCGGHAPTPTAQETPAAPDTVTLDDVSRRNAGITVAAAHTMTRADQTQASGVLALDERRTARIGSLVEGIVLESAAHVGDRVVTGQVLATMHSTVVHETWASYRKSIAERRRLEKELAYAISAHERALRLHADKAIALQEVQRAEANRGAAEEMLDMGRTEVRRSEEELEHLGITNAEDPTGESGEQIPVKSPIRGVVLAQLVTPGTTVTPGTPLFVVSDLSTLWALVEIDESLLSHVHIGLPVQVRVAAYPDERFDGRVEFVGDTVNPTSRRVTVRCAMSNADGRLKPEMYATVVIRENEPRDVVVVPAEAIQSVAGHPSVFIAEAPDRFRPRRIDTGPEIDGLVEVRAGIRAGEPLAVTGSFVLKTELLKAAAAPEE
jgi:cobalt-zinc-cadmium efflux system membrane fusion protein